MGKLNILICTINGREQVLTRLLSCLKPQLTNEVKVLISKDNKQISTGAKRNFLLDSATYDYVSFIDDDDLVSEDYVEKILEAIKSKPDVVGMEGIISFQKQGISRKFIHSLQYDHWFTKDNVYYRCPNHLSPVKRELALQARFPDVTVGEDHAYSKKLFPLLKTEIYIKTPIYYYYTK